MPVDTPRPTYVGPNVRVFASREEIAFLFRNLDVTPLMVEQAGKLGEEEVLLEQEEGSRMASLQIEEATVVSIFRRTPIRVPIPAEQGVSVETFEESEGSAYDIMMAEFGDFETERQVARVGGFVYDDDERTDCYGRWTHGSREISSLNIPGRCGKPVPALPTSRRERPRRCGDTPAVA